MMKELKTAYLLSASRFLSTSSSLSFKFKLTDELTKEFEELQRKKKPKPSPEPAIHTKEGSLIMGRVSSERYQKVVKVAIPKHRLNEFLLLYIRENDNIQVYDEKEECKPGDWILVRRQSKPLDIDVVHKVERIVYSFGKYIDPLTQRRSLGLYFEDDFKKLENVKISL